MTFEQKRDRALKAHAASAELGFSLADRTPEQRRAVGLAYGPAASYRAGRVRLQGAIERKRELIAEMETELHALTA